MKIKLKQVIHLNINNTNKGGVIITKDAIDKAIDEFKNLSTPLPLCIQDDYGYAICIGTATYDDKSSCYSADMNDFNLYVDCKIFENILKLDTNIFINEIDNKKITSFSFESASIKYK